MLGTRLTGHGECGSCVPGTHLQGWTPCQAPASPQPRQRQTLPHLCPLQTVSQGENAAAHLTSVMGQTPVDPIIPALMSGGTPAPKPKPDILVLQPLVSASGAEPAQQPRSRSAVPAVAGTPAAVIHPPAIPHRLLPQQDLFLSPTSCFRPLPCVCGTGVEHLLLVVTCRSSDLCQSTPEPGCS